MSQGELAAPLTPAQPNEPGLTDVPRWPDFFSINVNVAIPNPWTGTLVGGTGAVTIDENGDVYVGLGGSVGKTLTFISGSAGFWGGGAINDSPGTGTSATGLGFFSPQAGGGYTYSWHAGDLWQ